MELIFFASFLIFVLWMIRRHDKKYLTKNIKEALSTETKKELNIPSEKDPFSEEIAEKRSQKSASQKILDEMNK